MVNESLCDNMSILPFMHMQTQPGAPDECFSLYLPRVFSLVIVSAVYIPPQVGMDT